MPTKLKATPKDTIAATVKKKLHPHTVDILKQIDLTVDAELNQMKAGCSVFNPAKATPLQLATHQTELRLIKDPAFKRKLRRKQVKILAKEGRPVHLLGGKSLDDAHKELVGLFDQALSVPASLDVVVWGKELDNALSNIEKSAFQATPNQKTLEDIAWLDTLVRHIYTIKELLSDAPNRLKKIQTNSTPQVPLSTDLPFAPLRAKLSQECTKTAKDVLGKSMHYWGEPEMIAMCIGDATSHYGLGLALLDGRPELIDKASNMDTSPREWLTESVWDFVTGDELKGGLYTQALKARKQKKAIAKAVEGKGVSSPSNSIKKM